MKYLKNSFSIIIWAIILIVGNIVLTNQAIEFGKNVTEAWHRVQRHIVGSNEFWTVGILLIIQVIIMNLKPFKFKTVVTIILSIVIVITSIAFYKDLYSYMSNHHIISMNTNSEASEIGLAVFSYRKIIFLLSGVACILSVANMVVTIVFKKK